MSASQVILITGASSGVGLALAEAFHAAGHRVYGTSRRARVEQGKGIRWLQLEVTDDASVQAAVAQVMREAGRVDVLINNAGYHLFGAAEETTLSENRVQMETNFFGAVRMMQAVLPFMRMQRSGRIINISSTGGFLALPYTAAYTASKHALEGYSEALRLEALSFGVHVSLVEPAAVRTETRDQSIQSVAAADSAYIVGRRESLEEFKASFDRDAVPLSAVVSTVDAILRSPRPRLRYQVGSQARMLLLLKHLMPQTLLEVFLRRQFPVRVAHSPNMALTNATALNT